MHARYCKNGRYKHIVFDFGGVFLSLGGRHSGVPRDLARIFGISEKKAEEFWEGNKEEIITGRTTPRAFLALAGRKLSIKINVDKAYALWKSYNDIKKEQIDWRLLEYAKKLKGLYRIHLLTDTVDLGRNRWVSKVDGHFENVFMSHVEKLRKPDKKAFLNALRKMRAKPEECVFVDDVAANVEAASRLGMRGVLFKSVDKLKEDFARLGIA